MSSLVLHLAFAAALVACGLIMPRLWLVAHRARDRRRRADAERRARTMMGELCPHGWRAAIAVGDSGPVTLTWHELRPDDGEPAAVRRVRASSVAAALEAMVTGRLTDLALEQIEQHAVAAGARWPD